MVLIYYLWTSWRAVHSFAQLQNNPLIAAGSNHPPLMPQHSSGTWRKPPLQSIRTIMPTEPVCYFRVNGKPSLAVLWEVLREPKINVLCGIFVLKEQNISRAFVSKTTCWISPFVYLVKSTGLASVFKGLLMHVILPCISSNVPIGITSPHWRLF